MKIDFNKLKQIDKKKAIYFSLIGIALIIIIVLPFTFSNSNTDSSYNDGVVLSKENADRKNNWNRYKKINEDYVGQIEFDSGLINKPFVQARSCYRSNGEPYKFFNQDGSVVTNYDNHNGNDVYIWMDFETMKYDYDNKGGSIFLDYRNNLDDQNLIIYGHYFSTIYNKDPERVKAFTPLEVLLDSSEYGNHKIARVILQNEIRTYELWAVYKFDSSNPEFFNKCQYYRPNYYVDDYLNIIDDDYYSNYIDFVNEIKLYDTGVKLSTDDKTLTLQTCMTPNNNLYEICVFKQVSIEKY